MNKIRIFFILGIWLLILPYLGFPYSWKDTLITLSGLIIIYVSYLLYKEAKKETKAFDNFSENNFFGKTKVETHENTEAK